MPKRFVIASRDDGENIYWNGRCWTKISSDIKLMTGAEVDAFLTHVLHDTRGLEVIDWIARGDRTAVWNAAFAASLETAGYDDMPKDDPRRAVAVANARAAGADALRAANLTGF